MEHFRLFVALEVPEPVKDELERVQDRLRAQIKAEARWTKREQWHLTLKFLGNVEVEQVPALTEALRQACSTFSALELRAVDVGFFPNARRPRVVWVGVDDAHGQLGKLAAAVEQASRPFTSEQSEEKFVGHITLARVKEISRRDAAAFEQFSARYAGQCLGTWAAEGVSLMRSELGPMGAKHSVITSLPFVKT